MRLAFTLVLLSAVAGAAPKVEDTKLPDKAVGALKVGMRVKLVARDGGLEPKETGHARMVARGPGQLGTITHFVRRKVTFEWSPQPSIFTVAFVRFDAQSWNEWEPAFDRMKQGKIYSSDEINALNELMGPAVKLHAFTTAITLELLAPAG